MKFSRVSVILVFSIISCPPEIKTQLQPADSSVSAQLQPPPVNQTGATQLQPPDKASQRSGNPTEPTWDLECTRDSCPTIRCNDTKCNYPGDFEGHLANVRSVLGRAESLLKTISSVTWGTSQDTSGNSPFIPKVVAAILVKTVKPILSELTESSKRLAEFNKYDDLAPIIGTITRDLTLMQQVVENIVAFLQGQSEGKHEAIPETVLKRIQNFQDWSPACVGQWPCLRIVSNYNSSGVTTPRPGFCLGRICISAGLYIARDKAQDQIAPDLQDQSTPKPQDPTAPSSTVPTSSPGLIEGENQTNSYNEGARLNMKVDTEETAYNSNPGMQISQTYYGQDAAFKHMTQGADTSYVVRQGPNYNQAFAAVSGPNTAPQYLSSNNPTFQAIPNNNAIHRGVLQAQTSFNTAPRLPYNNPTFQRAPNQYQAPPASSSNLASQIESNSGIYQRVSQAPSSFIQEPRNNMVINPNFLRTYEFLVPQDAPNFSTVLGSFPQASSSRNQQIQHNPIPLGAMNEYQLIRPASIYEKSFSGAPDFPPSHHSVSYNPNSQAAPGSNGNSQVYNPSVNRTPQTSFSYNIAAQDYQSSIQPSVQGSVRYYAPTYYTLGGGGSTSTQGALNYPNPTAQTLTTSEESQQPALAASNQEAYQDSSVGPTLQSSSSSYSKLAQDYNSSVQPTSQASITYQIPIYYSPGTSSTSGAPNYPSATSQTVTNLDPQPTIVAYQYEQSSQIKPPAS